MSQHEQLRKALERIADMDEFALLNESEEVARAALAAPAETGSVDDGGPAFPCQLAEHHKLNGRVVMSDGISLRDYFAGQAMQGMLACQSFMNETITLHCGSREEARKQVAAWAVSQADALLAALKEPQP